ncbi:MAG: hypothetical protein ACOC46_01405, partial [Pirellulales bacterium]
VAALAKAGFHGEAKMDDKAIAFPESGAKKGQKADQVVVEGLHICCPACIKAIAAAFEDVAAVDEVQCDKATRTCTLTGSDVSLTEAIAVLNGSGFHGTVKK